MELDVPFLAMSGRHGTMASLESMQGGIGIRLDKLNSVGISADHSTARIGGGASTKDVTDALWKANKQTGKSIDLPIQPVTSNKSSYWNM